MFLSRTTSFNISPRTAIGSISSPASFPGSTNNIIFTLRIGSISSSISFPGCFKNQYAFLHSDRKLEPVRSEFTRVSKTEDLMSIPNITGLHHKPENISDHVAYRTVKFLRVFADLFFQKRYIHRAVLLETVAAVPGMVAGLMRHLRSLRKMQHDGGWIHHLLLEAENERMHLLTWMKITTPKWYERLLVTVVQLIFYNCYFWTYLFFPKTAHRIVGYLEEEAVVSYTAFLKSIDNGDIENIPAPTIAIKYWNLSNDAKLRDVVLAVRADEAAHRDANHEFADRIKGNCQNLSNPFPIAKDHEN